MKLMVYFDKISIFYWKNINFINFILMIKLFVELNPHATELIFHSPVQANKVDLFGT